MASHCGVVFADHCLTAGEQGTSDKGWELMLQWHPSRAELRIQEVDLGILSHLMLEKQKGTWGSKMMLSKGCQPSLKSPHYRSTCSSYTFVDCIWFVLGALLMSCLMSAGQVSLPPEHECRWTGSLPLL